VWLRVPAIIALVLVAVLISTNLLTAAGVGGRGPDHGSGDMTQMMDHTSGEHGASDVMPRMDHPGSSGGHGAAIGTPEAR